MRKSPVAILTLCLGALVFIARAVGCNYDVTWNPNATGSTATSGISVSVTPQSASIQTSGSVSLAASIKGFKSDSTLKWSLSDTIGSLDVTGENAIYKAPASLKLSPKIVIVRVQSNEDTSRSAYCTITITSSAPIDTTKPQISLTPIAVTLQPSQTQQFTATITGSTNTGVIWTLVAGPGTLSAQGLYTAPTSITGTSDAFVKATAAVDTSVWAEAQITISVPDTMPCFTSQIQPLINSNCTMAGCHSAGAHGEARDLTTYAGLMSYVRTGNASSSRLYQAITGRDDRMPPSPASPLTADQIALIARWINDGAPNNSCDQGTAGCDTTNVHYSTFVKTMVSTYCLGCHSGPNVANSGNVDLSTYNGVQTYALNGQLVGTITQTPPLPLMPQNGPQLDSCTIAKVRAWVNKGAPND